MTDQTENMLETIKDEIKAAAVSRFNSPFVGAFLVSWVLWNHRLIFALFSSLPLGERFHYIDEVLYPTTGAFALHHLIGPTLSTILYIFVMPWPTEWVHRWNLQRKLRLRHAELRAEGHRLLTEMESHQLLTKVGELKESLARMRGELTSERRKTRALSLQTMAGRKDEDIKAIHTAYLTSQAFTIRAGKAAFPDPTHIRFTADGAVDIPGFSNVRWAYAKNSIHLYDADQEQGAMGQLQFAVHSNTFEGTLEGLGLVQIKGVYSHVDFI